MLTLRALFAAVANAAEPPRMSSHRDGVSLLGYGAMRIPTVDGDVANSSSSPIDQPRFNAQVKLLLDGGVNLFDTSAAYCRGHSESALGTALAASGYPREKYFLSTKLSNFARRQHSAEESKRIFENALVNLKTDYLDYFLLHSVGGKDFDARFVKNGMLDWVFEQKRLGRIRHVGFSIHGDHERFRWLLRRHDEGRYRWDVALIQMNYVDWHHASEVNKRNENAEYLYNELTRRGIGVLIMEPLLGGRLAKPRDAVMAELAPLDPGATPAKWAFRFCGSHPGVISVISGMSFEEHIRENIETFSPLKPLSDVERLALERAAAAFVGCEAVPCTECNYCMPCPYGLDIPALIGFINDVRRRRLSGRRELRALYERAVDDPRRRADRCIGCARCLSHCPQQIDIPKVMDSIAGFMEEYA